MSVITGIFVENSSLISKFQNSPQNQKLEKPAFQKISFEKRG